MSTELISSFRGGASKIKVSPAVNWVEMAWSLWGESLKRFNACSTITRFWSYAGGSVIPPSSTRGLETVPRRVTEIEEAQNGSPFRGVLIRSFIVPFNR